MKTSGAVILFFMAICSIIGAILWPYSINTWLEFFGKEPSIVWWHGVLMGFCPVLGQITIPVSVGTWILMLFL